MAIRSQRVLASYLTRLWAPPPGGPLRTSPVKIVLDVVPGTPPSGKPPVRIFIGTESSQFRAERILVWSISRVRDPSRVYEIYLMKNLAGFRHGLWLTGFTNYRFAIPHFAGGQGRAIYNDADQIYLEDPAHLFDTEMGDHGVLSINDHDTSVMLMDCARMADIWNPVTAATVTRRKLEARMRRTPGLWGPLDAGWNTRGEECDRQHVRLIHYTTIHSQPWRPAPRDYIYENCPAGDIWCELERDADAAGFQLFTARRPSTEFRVEGITGSERGRRLAEWIEREWSGIVSDLDAETTLYYGQGRLPDRLTGGQAAPSRPVHVTAGTSVRLQAGNGGTGGAYDLVVAGNLESVPEWDLPWLLDHLFARSGRALAVAVDITRASAAPADPLWWWAQLSDAGRRHPDVHWRLAVRHRRRLIPGIARWSGGPPAHLPPRTWVLLYYKSGHRSQALGIADSLGLPYETREIQRTMPRYALAALIGMVAGKLGAGGGRLPGGIEPPWPDIIISSGWLTGLIARWVARRTGGATRLVLMGRKAGPVGESQGVVISCHHFQLPPHPRRIETLLPPSKVNSRQLEEAAARWPRPFGDRPSPRVALLIGGSTRSYRLDGRDAADLLTSVQAQVREAGGTLAVLTSPRTGRAATQALQGVAGEDVIVDVWRKGRRDNPYLGFLAGADILIVTGESESMLAEAITAGKPVYIAQLPRRRQTPLQWAGNWVHTRAHRDRLNKRGSRRPQQGLQYLCALLVEHRLILPERGLEQLHDKLVEAGFARFLGARLECWRPQPWREPVEVAERVRELLGLAPFPDRDGTCKEIDVAAHD